MDEYYTYYKVSLRDILKELKRNKKAGVKQVRTDKQVNNQNGGVRNSIQK
jgi:hypothetical protein